MTNTRPARAPAVNAPLVVTGPGAIREAARLASQLSGGQGQRARVVQVVGPTFQARTWAPRVSEALAGLRPTLAVHDGPVTPGSVAALAGELRAACADVVVAVGGGTVLDAAKSAAALAPAGPVDAGQVAAACAAPQPGSDPASQVAVIAVPTTAGTGAEVTPFATLWDLASSRKLSLRGAKLRPRAAILDPQLLAGLSRAELATGLLDTVCQGAEASWSIRSTKVSRKWGTHAVVLAAHALDRVRDGDVDTAVLATLQRAGHCSGRAIAVAQTSSCHAISYPLTLRLGLAHGHACGVSLGRMLLFNSAVRPDDCGDPRGPGHVRAVLGRLAQALGGTAGQAAARVESFLRACDLDDLPLDHRGVAADALSYPRCGDNPRRLDRESLRRLLGGAADTEQT